MRGLIDALLPEYDVREYHEIEVRTDASRAFDSVLECDLTGSALLRILLAIREIPCALMGGNPRRVFDRGKHRYTRLRDLSALGFHVVGLEPGREIALGIKGRFWMPNGGVLASGGNAPDTFISQPPAGYTTAVWTFTISPVSPALSLVSTETRVLCGGSAARRKFKLYWRVVGRFSGLIRREMLRAIKTHAENKSPAVLPSSP